MTLSAREEVNLDHQKAEKYINEYPEDINDAFFARGQILNLAMNQFNKFLALPEKSSKSSAIWELAFGILSTAIPALRLGEFVVKQHKAATLALEIAKAAGNKARLAKTVKVGTGAAIGAGKAANKINDAKEKVDKIKEAGSKVMAEEESIPKQFADFDTSRKIIHDLIADLKSAKKAWKEASNAEMQEFENRYRGLPPSKKGTLEEYIKELLPPYPEFTADELKQIERRFLWEMIGEHVRKNVKLVNTTEVTMVVTGTNTTYHPSKNKTVSIEGLNGNQKDAIIEFFGTNGHRGKYMPYGPIFNVYTFLYLQKVPETQKTEYTPVFSESLK